MKRILLISLTTLLFNVSFITKTFAKTNNVAAGDIAFVGFNTDSPDGFSWVALKNIPAGEIIYFTEQGWKELPTAGWYDNTEFHLSWTSPAGGLAAGSIVSIVESLSTPDQLILTGGGTLGSLLQKDGISATSFNFAGGESIIAYQGTIGSVNPTFIAGIYLDDNFAHTSGCDNTTTTWFTNNIGACNPGNTPATYSVNISSLPASLTNAVNAISLFPNPDLEADNVKYNGPFSGTAAELRIAINNHANWIKDDVNIQNIVPSAYNSGNGFSVASESPEINIRGRNVTINSGDITPRTGDNTDFGRVFTSGVTITQTFKIENTGIGTLTLSGNPSITGTNAGDFTVVANPSLSILAGGSTTFDVRFDPAATGNRTATITINNNDSNEGSYTFSISGTGQSTSQVRWVNNRGLTKPSTVSINGVTYNTSSLAYSDIQTAINDAVSDDIVYITDGVYRNALESTSTNCSLFGTAQDLGLYLNVLNKGITITSSTGNHCNSNARLVGYGFLLNASHNTVIQGLHIDSVRVNAFWNSNCCGYNPAHNVKILNNKITNTRGHGIKTDSPADNGFSVDKQAWDISGNYFENIGFYNGNGFCTTPAAVSGVWIADAGSSMLISNNAINNTNWGGILAVGYGGGTFLVNDGAVTISGNRVNQTIDAGIQIGFPTASYYAPKNAFVNNNEITNANTSNKVGIGGLTILQSNIGGVNITNNSVSSSFNGLAIEIAGWQQSPDVKYINNNNFSNLSPGSYGVTHIGGIEPNGFFGTADDLAFYNFENNYWGASTGPTYATNPSGTGAGLLKETTVKGTGVNAKVYSVGDFDFTPFSTSANTVSAVSLACCEVPSASISYASSTLSQISSSPISPTITGNPSGVFTSSPAGLTINKDYGQISASTSQGGTYTVTYTLGASGGCSVFTSTALITIQAPDINLKGNGFSIAHTDITPSIADHSDFGSVVAASGTITRTFTIENTGNATLTLNTNPVSKSGTNAADFTITQPSNNTLAPNSSITFTITFDPSAVGLRTATLSISSNDLDENAYIFAIQGTGDASSPEINLKGNNTSISDGDLTPSLSDHTDFGSQTVSSGTVVRTFTIENTGAGALTLGGTPKVVIGGTHFTDFTVNVQPTSPVAATNGTTTFEVTFDPSASGTRTATVSITNNDTDENPYNFSIQGTGTVPTADLAVVLSVNDNTPDQAQVITYTMVVSNSGPDPATNFEVTDILPAGLTFVPGSMTGPGTYVSTSPTITGLKWQNLFLQNGGSLVLSFQATVTGAGGSSITNFAQVTASSENDPDSTPNNGNIGEDDGDTEVINVNNLIPEINIKGNNVSIIDGDTSPDLADHTDFGLQTVSSGTVVRTFTIENTGIGALTLGGTPKVVIGGTNAADFTVNLQPTSPVAATNGTTTFQVTFDPSASGTRTATVSIANDDANENPYNFSIQGTGTGNPFITTWNLATSGSGANQLSFSVETAGMVNYTWTTVPSGTTGSGTLTGPIAIITGLPAGATIDLSIYPENFQRININDGTDKSRMISLKQWGEVAWTSMENAFYGCENMNITSSDIPNLSGVTNASGMFKNCLVLDGPSNINSWNVSTFQNTKEMFLSAEKFNQNIGAWNTAADTTMGGMFTAALLFNQNIGSWNTSAVRDMSYMFSNATSFNQAIGTWNTGNVKNMKSMFQTASLFNQNIGNWNTAKVTDMASMFSGSTFNQNIGNWNTSAVKDMTGMFGNATAFNQNISGWNTSSVTAMGGMFLLATTFNQNISSWDISSVTYMLNMFDRASAFNQSLALWGTKFKGDVNLISFLDDCGMSVANYDATLTGFNAGTVTSRTLGAKGLQYCASASDRANLVLSTSSGGKGWLISFDSQTTSCLSPEINIKGNNVSIIDGDGTPIITDHSDFGPQTVASGTIVRTFTIENTGTGALNLGTNPISKSGTHASDFTITQPSVTSVAAGSSTTFSVTFDPSASGLRTASISIANSDADENPYNFSIEGYGGRPFVTTWKTDNPGISNSTSISIPTFGTGYNYDIDWDNDGTFDQFDITGNALHDYGVTGTYTIAIRGSFPRIFLDGGSDFNKILNINQWGDIEWTTFERAFSFCLNLNSTATDSPDLSGVSSLHKMFQGATSFNGNIGGWNTQTITDMSSMFAGASAFNQNIGTWNTQNVTNMERLFSGATAFNQNIGAWNVSAVTTMKGMFSTATNFNQNIGTWNVNQVTDMSLMFNAARAFNQNIGAWNVGNVTDMNGMFSNATNFNQNIGTWNVSKVTNMLNMFNEATNFNQNIGAWNVGAVTSMSQMFSQATSFNQNIGPWNVSAVTNMSSMFNEATAFNQNIEAWNVGAVTNMSGMFYGATTFNQNISTWNVSNVTSMGYMFNGATAFNENIGTWNIANVTFALNMFLNSGISLNNYDAILIAWDAAGYTNKNLGNTSPLTYCAGQAARTNMTTNKGWSISGDTYTASCLIPEINIKGNNVSILDGDITPSVSDHTDFGSQTVSSGSIIRTFTIENTGTGALTLSGSPKVAISGGNASDFSVTTQPSSPVAATTGTTTFQVTFDPSASGIRSTTISIVNDDADENPYNFSIQGTGCNSTASISYTGSPFCKTASAVNVNQTGATGGTFTSSPAGLTLSGAGQITPSSSTAGTYTITYTVAASGGCAAVTATTSVTITDNPTASISYTGSPFCKTSSAVNVNQTGTTGGTFTSSPAGLTLSGAGQITPSSSTAGTYTITYTVAASGGCAAVTATTSVTITDNPTASISYTGSPFCKTASAVNVNQTGSTGGTFTSSPAGLTLSGAGQITPSSSTAGTYTITYTVAASGGCAAVTATTSVTITDNPTASISYTGSPFCKTASAVNVNQTGATGGIFTSSPAGLTLSGTGQVTPSSSTAGTYTITYTVAASGGCAAVTATTSVTITDNPTASISYTGSPFCKTASAVNVNQTGATGGTFTSSPAGLTLSGAGQITPNSSTAGTYTITYSVAASGGCAAVTATASVTITETPTASISYTGSPFCKTASAVNVNQTGATGGTFTSSPAGLTLSGAGQITPSSSTAGTYTITYTVAASGGCAAVTATTSVTITDNPTASISYTGSPFCKTASAINVNQTGATGGTFTSSPAGLTLSGAGQITPSSSTAGTYTITYTVAASGGCAAVTATTSVTITDNPTASISYTGSPFCKTASPASVSLTGTTGGGFTSAPAGLSINATTGQITPSSSTAGVYTVTYTIAASGGCSSATATTSVTISSNPSATISYAGTPYCSTASPASVSLTGTTGGGFTSAPAGLTINATTGQITPSSSTAGVYTVTYTIVASGGCSSATATTSVMISSNPSATISYAGTPYCSTASPASVSLTGTTGGGFTSAPAGLSINATTGQITPSSSTAGVYTVTYTIAASGGCSSATATTSVTISNGPPIINQPQNVSICQGNNATFTVETNQTGVTYQWEVNTGAGFVAVAASTVYSGQNTATLSLAFPPSTYSGYQYRCVVSKNGCSATSEAATLSLSGSAEALNIVNVSPISGVYNQTAVAYTIALNKIEPNANVLFKSGNAIELLPGFETRAGAVFATKIESPCGLNSTNNSIFENLPKEIRK